MNRPTNRPLYSDELEEYVDELERYCDYLVEEYHELKEKYKSDVIEYERALDKVCELLEDCPLSTLDKELDCNNCTDDYAKCWKELLLKDE